MHQPQQFGMREIPAPDRRHGSRPGTPGLLDSEVKHIAARSGLDVFPATVTPLESECRNDAASRHAATEGEESKADKPSRESLGHDQTNPVERPLTCEEAARLVRVHPKTVKRMARNDELPGHFRFGRWYFYASELDSWMRTELQSSRHSCR